MLEHLRSGLDSLLLTLLPPRCGACSEPLSAYPRYGLCAVCYEVLEPNIGERCGLCDLPGDDPCGACRVDPPAFTRLVAPYIYGGSLAELVVATKFHGREDLAHALGRLLGDRESVRGLADKATVIVPVPLGKKRRRQRGFNQSATIARTLGDALRLPIRHALTRRRETLPQSDLSATQRRANIQGSFGVARPLTQRVLLVDDVVTSGETVRQAAAALRAAGAAEIVVAALARAAV